jgi:hypothetical protein
VYCVTRASCASCATRSDATTIFLLANTVGRN